MNKKYGKLRIEYSETDKNSFKILMINDDEVVKSMDLTSLDAARIHHVLGNIEESLRYELKFSTKELSAIKPLLIIKESNVSLFINRIEIHDWHEKDTGVDICYYTFTCFKDIDVLKNYFAEAQY